MSDALHALGSAIRQVREDRGLSQERLAELADLHRTYVSSVELGRRNISFENIYRIANALGVSMTELVQLCEDRFDPSRSERKRSGDGRRSR
jgi:transcriptional regulator with XRE-family HTH domain